MFSIAPEEAQRFLRKKQKLSMMNQQIELSKNQNNNIPQQQIAQRDNLRKEIETILAAECTMCGSLMIQQLDKPFPISDEEW